LDRKFLPLLYNRRHAGVTMALLSLVHAALVVITYHAGGDTNPILSIFSGSPLTRSIAGVPFQPFGFFALVVLLLMAATSHDFWLANLSAPTWKRLHILVYLAWGLLIAHVALGVLQSERALLPTIALGVGIATVLTLHLFAGFRELGPDRELPRRDDGMVDVCGVDEIPDTRARVVTVGGERVAVFRWDDRIAAVSNVCRHQNGPLGEGKIIAGCITCPWHGYQYDPETGASPPPFTETVPTFRVAIEAGRVLVEPTPYPPGTRLEAVRIEP
jgi:nitrite reductase/ring-hydroxylating ferredoxin subunit/DMSO/TMAO reductase YedYZ heme-binding membrane subunit